MNNYITLDDFNYKTSGRSWEPEVLKPSRVRLLLDESLDAAFGSGVLREWAGEIMVDVTPEPGFGSADDLRRSLDQTEKLAFIDHYGDVYEVAVQGYKQRSLSVKWDSPTNVLYFSVKLIGKPV